MTVITCFPCHENHLKKYRIQPSTSLQSLLGENRFWLRKLLQSSKSRRDIFRSMNSDCGEDVVNDVYNSGIVALDSVNVKDAALKIRLRMAGRRKNGQQKNGKQKKDDSGNGYERNGESQRNRTTSQGNGSSGMEGSGEGSGNGDESSDDDDDDCDDDNDGEDEPDEEEEEEDDEEDDDDEMEEEAEEDTDNVSPTVEDDMEESSRNGCMDGETLSTSLELKRLEFENPAPLVASGTLEVLSSGDVKQSTEEDAVAAVMAPAVPGTPVTLSGVIWKETMGGVLVVNLKWRNKMYSGSLIDHSRYGWATPRIMDDAKESKMLASKRGKGKKGKHKGSAYTGNPLSPKMTGSGKRGPRFLHNKGKHGKDLFARPRAKRALESDTAEEGTRTRRRSCTVKTSISPSPSPTPLIECPERNCNKKYKHINGLRYHQAHAHLDSVADADEKDSDEDEETKSTDIKEPMSAHSKSSSSDDVKPLSRRKAKSQKSNSSNKSNDTVIPEEDSVENESNKSEKEKVEETGEKYDVTNIKIEPEEMIKSEEENGCTPAPNILQEAAKILFDEPSGPGSQDITFNTDVVHPGIFARMTSQAMMVTSNPGKYKYVSYEPMTESMSGYSEKTGSSVEVHEMGITIKEEVIEEGNAGMGKLTCKEQSDESLKLENLEAHFNRERPHDRTIEPPESDKNEWLIDKGIKSGNNNNNTRKSTPTDGVAVTKDTNQLKTSAAEIRSLPGYQHFRVNSNTNFGSYVSPSCEEKESKTLDAGLGEAKEPQKSGLNGDNGGTAKQQGSFETQENKAMVWKVQGAPATSSASFQLSCETKNLIRPGYISVASSKKPSARSVVTASTTWVPEVHPALMQKMTGGSLPGQEVLPEKPSVARETADKARTAGGSCEEEEDEKTKNELGKFDDDRPKASFIGKPGRAVGVAHPFNTEKNEGEFALGSIGSFSSDPVKVLFSQSSSPKISLDLTHTDITEVKKVRVEKTLDVPVGEVIPLGKTSRSAVTATETRDAIIAGSKGTEHYSGIRATITDNRVSQPVDSISSQRDMNIQPSYIPAVAEHSSPWRPASSYSPPRDSVPRSFRDHSQRYATTETSSPSRKVSRRSPVSEADRSPPFRSSARGYTGIDTGRRTPEKDAAKRVLQRVTDKRLPFNNFDERSSQRDNNTGMPFRDIGRSSPEKDTSGRVPLKGTGERSTYRDSDKRSSHGESVSGRDCDRSPLRDNVRRSPGPDRRSPNREVVARASYRDTSPNPSNRDATRHSPYRETDRVKAARDDDTLTLRRDTRSPEERSRNIDSTRTHPSKSDAKPTKDVAELNVESQRMAADNKFPNLNEEEARMLRLRAPFYPYPPAPQDSATLEAMENYMMYLSRLQMQTMDPRFLQAYPMMPMLLQPQKETAVPKEERTKKVPEETRNKSSGNKSETQRNRALPLSESSDVELVVNKRHLDGSGSSSSKGAEKAEYESSPSKRPKASEPKDGDDRDGSRMQYKQLEQKVLHQQYQHKMDAFNQLQTEKNLKQKAEEKNSSRSKVSPGSNSSRLKPAMECRTPSKKEESIFSGSTSYEKEKVTSKDEKSRLSPATRPSINTASEGVQYRMTSRNSENKSPHGGTYPGYLTGANLPANHGLSNSYEQATMAMQGMPPFIMPAAFHHPPGIMIANPLVAGAEYHNAVTSRHLDSKRDSSRSSSTSTTTTDRGRTRDDDVHEVDTREYTSQTKKDVSSNSSKNTSSSPSPKPEVEKERGRERTRREYEGKQRTLRDKLSFQGSQNLPSNLAFHRGNMSTVDPHFNQVFPHLMYPPAQGNFRPPFERPYIPYPRK